MIRFVLCIFFLLVIKPVLSLAQTDAGVFSVQDELQLKLIHGTNLRYKFSKAAFEGFSVKLSVVKSNKSTILKDISVNDSLCYKLIPEMDSLLKSVNYLPLLGERNSGEFILPIAVIYAGFEGTPADTQISVVGLNKKIARLFFDNDDPKTYRNYVFLSPLIISWSSGY